MAFLVVVTGPPGAGKSTVAHALADSFEPSALVAGDAFFGILARGAIAPWLPAAHSQNEVVTRAAAAATGHFVAGGYTTVYDGVLGPGFLAEFAAEAAVDQLHYVVLLPPVRWCVDQVANRSGHGFTDEDATREMHRQFAQAAIDQRHVLADLPGSPAQTAAEIARRVKSGAVRYP
jgi:predicted ABC-type ATPase